MDQRQTGITRTIIKDPQTGRTETVYEHRKTNLQFWLTIVIQILTIGGVVFGAVRFGLITETRDTIKTEMQDGGIIKSGMEKCVHEHMKPINENIDDLENEVIISKTIQKEIRDDIKEIKDDVKDIKRDGT